MRRLRWPSEHILKQWEGGPYCMPRKAARQIRALSQLESWVRRISRRALAQVMIDGTGAMIDGTGASALRLIPKFNCDKALATSTRHSLLASIILADANSLDTEGFAGGWVDFDHRAAESYVAGGYVEGGRRGREPGSSARGRSAGRGCYRAGPVIPTSHWKAVPPGRMHSSAVGTWVWVPSTADTRPSR